MRLHTLTAGAFALALTAGAALPVQAEDSVYIQLATYRTGAFAGSGIPVANGMFDYLTMLNERDGGINGVKITLEECETGYDTQKGVECYEQAKSKGTLVFNPYSTGITLQVIPKASVDKIPVLSMAYGLSAAADGNTFPWVFNPPLTYWDGASGIIKYIGEQEGGMDKLAGKKIGYIFLDAGYGREAIPLLESMAAEYGFEMVQYPVPGKEMQNQASQWLNVRRDKPDYMVMWGWGAMNPTAVKEATKIRYPMDKFIGVWWSGGEDDARAGGMDAKGYKTLNFNGVGADYPAIQDIKKYVVDAGKSQVEPAKLGENLYNRGVMNAVLMAEAIRVAQEKTGKTVINSEDMRLGLENLNIDEARLEAIGLTGFMAPMKTSCEAHSGHHAMYVQQWNGEAWEKASDWFEPMTDKVKPLLAAAAEEYKTSNAPWPARTEPCAN
ncbi:MAG: ABC transporter substrate-binding protein [Hoeflea sp.]|uniref:ABC transporter substrate-binding protein n=1 Tax=Hoeflea sp. TaxID=1940281 RepID=UPI00272F3917|nr:ABC transporter substrate-binding protein [Hoeflea sp.]MDP2118360.1 ABC transporter substrate-binding protein [Hoeflea sp.]MDZ7602408.1 ABC transporter substrate-binding protein [Hoeflea sp.]